MGANWIDDVAPGDGDDAVITNTGALAILSSPSAHLASLVLSKSLIFTNWTTVLYATNVTIKSGGAMTLPVAFTESQMSNRVHIVCTDMMIDTNGAINANESGYTCDNGTGKGIGAGQGGASSGGHGGRGGDQVNLSQAASAAAVLGGTAYGSSSAPLAPGSGGGSYTTPAYPGGKGGGAIRIDAADGSVTVNGAITANGGGGNYGGGGSGGSVYITCATFGGSTNGLISVKGGNAPNSPRGAGGAGGRIAVDYQDVAPTCLVRFDAGRGIGVLNDWLTSRLSAYGESPELGTLYFPNTNLLTEVVNLTGHLTVPGFTSWTPERLVISNRMVRFDDGFTLNVAGDLQVRSGGALVLKGSPQLTCGGNLLVDGGDLAVNVNAELVCGGNLVVTNGGRLYAQSGPTNGTATYGGLVSVTGGVRIASSSWIYPYSDGTNGGSLLFRMGSLMIAPNGGIDADAAGFARDTGPGKGTPGNRGGGAGYGGVGGAGKSNRAGGPIYGLTNAPFEPGSGGGSYAVAQGHTAGAGGGSVRLKVAGGVTLNGHIKASGELGRYSGGGSGGGIFITCDTFTGSASGSMHADGTNCVQLAEGGGGGGGRIAIGLGLSDAERNQLLAGSPVDGLITYTTHADYAGGSSATNGLGYVNGSPGMAHFMTVAYSLFVDADPVAYGTPTPYGYGTHINIPIGSWATNTVDSPVDQANGLRRMCWGWDLEGADGSPISSGTNTQAPFLMNTNLVLSWHWTNEYALIVSSGNPARGSATTNENGWYTDGVEVSTLSAVASTGYAFGVWTGDVPTGMETNNPLTVTMDQARTLAAQFYSTSGETKTWAGVGNWATSSGNWSPAGMPSPLDRIIFESGTVTLSEPRSAAAVIVSNTAALVFTNWTTTLTASNVTVQSGGEITLASAFADGQMSNRVHIICTNFTVESGGSIDADAKGFRYDSGPGKGEGALGYGAGGGYGGGGGDVQAYGAGGSTYGAADAPIAPGSGGGSHVAPTDVGGSGGGAIRIEAMGNVTVNGTVTANGETVTGSGGGSGGGIFISCKKFGGSASGLLRARGGNTSSLGGGGGGGRIAIDYQDLAGTVDVRFDALPGTGFYNGWCRSVVYPFRNPAVMGTVCFPDTSLLSTVMKQVSGRLMIAGLTSWAPSSLFVTNCTVRLPDGINLDIVGDLRVASDGKLVLLGTPQVACGGDVVLDNGELVVNVSSQLVCQGDVVLTNGGKLHVQSGATNELTGIGGQFSVVGDVAVGSSCWIYPHSDLTNGGSVLFRMNNMMIAVNGGIDADSRGYTYDSGPGKGTLANRGGGGGYGGAGGMGAGNRPGGPTYGSTNTPVDPGSGGGSYDVFSGYNGGAGGGNVRVEATGNITVDGTITASGGLGNYGGGGSGGGIFILCRNLGGGGSLRAQGGSGVPEAEGGGGGGGRIAVWYGMSAGDRVRGLEGNIRSSSFTTNITEAAFDFSGTASVTNGTGYQNGFSGTMVFLKGPPRGTIVVIR